MPLLARYLARIARKRGALSTAYVHDRAEPQAVRGEDHIDYTSQHLSHGRIGYRCLLRAFSIPIPKADTVDVPECILARHHAVPQFAPGLPDRRTPNVRGQGHTRTRRICSESDTDLSERERCIVAFHQYAHGRKRVEQAITRIEDAPMWLGQSRYWIEAQSSVDRRC